MARWTSFVGGASVGAVLALALAGASVRGAGPARKYVNLPGRAVQAPFSDGVLAGDTLYLSGRLGLDPKTGQAPADLDQEIKLLLDGFKSVLAEAGMAMDDLAYVHVFCPDLALYDRFNTAYRTYFAKDFPARAFIGSGPLLRGAHFEMQAIAVRR